MENKNLKRDIKYLIHNLQTSNFVYVNGESNISNWKGINIIIFFMYLVGLLFGIVKDYWILTNLIPLSLLIYKDYKINNMEFDRKVIIKSLQELFEKIITNEHKNYRQKNRHKNKN